MPIKVIHFSIVALELFIEVSKGFYHELDGVGVEVFVLFGIDLLWCENEGRSDFLVG